MNKLKIPSKNRKTTGGKVAVNSVWFHGNIVLDLKILFQFQLIFQNYTLIEEKGGGGEGNIQSLLMKKYASIDDLFLQCE